MQRPRVAARRGPPEAKIILFHAPFCMPHPVHINFYQYFHFLNSAMSIFHSSG
jgi:hypothetical protein